MLPILASHDPPTNHQKSIHLPIKHPLQPSLPRHLILFEPQFYYTRNLSATWRSPSNFYFLNILTLSLLDILLNAVVYFTLQSPLRDLYTVWSLAAEATAHVTFVTSVVLWLHFVILNALRTGSDEHIAWTRVYFWTDWKDSKECIAFDKRNIFLKFNEHF